MSKINQPIKIISVVIIITIIAKILGFLRILFLAKAFGTGIEASAFEAAYKIPNILFTSIGVSLSTTFIPIFTEYQNKKSKDEAMVFANNVLNILLFFTTIISIIGVIIAPIIVKIIYIGFEGEIYNLTVDLVRIMFPIIILIALSFTSVGILQSLGRFNIPAGISIPSNIINIIYLVFFSHIWGIYGFAFAILIGWCSQFIIQIPSLIKEDFKYIFTLSFKHEGIKKMLIMVVPIILGSSVQQINSLVDGAIASNLSESAVSALGYGFNLYIIIVGVFTYALSSVIFPSLSKMYISKDYENFKETINSALKSILIVLTPIMFGIIVLNTPIIKLLLERGKFDLTSTKITSSVLLFYSLGMLGFGIQELLNKAFYALHDTKTPMKISVAGMILNIILSIILAQYFDIKGIALATSIASVFIAALLLCKLSKLIPSLIQTETKAVFIKTLISSMIMGISIYYIYKLFYLAFDNLLVSVLLSIFIGGIIYFTVILVLKVKEMHQVLILIKNRFLK